MFIYKGIRNVENKCEMVKQESKMKKGKKNLRAGMSRAIHADYQKQSQFFA